MNTDNIRAKVVVISGASSGLGGGYGAATPESV
jgi:NADP-dependent 3-hydroxy acid dehydrogenase YdfG